MDTTDPPGTSASSSIPSQNESPPSSFSDRGENNENSPPLENHENQRENHDNHDNQRAQNSPQRRRIARVNIRVQGMPPRHPAFDNVRQRLFHMLFVRIALGYARIFPAPVRRFLEFAVLVKALLFLSILAYVHYAFTMTPATCLESVKNSWPKDGILRVEIVRPEFLRPPQDFDYDFYYDMDSSFTTPVNEEKSVSNLVSKNPNFLDIVFGRWKGKLRQENSTQSLNRFSPYLILSNIDNEDQLIKLPMAEEKDPATLTWAEFFVDLFFPQPEWPDDLSIVEYAREFGFLRLSPKTRQRLGISVMTVQLDPKSNPCFGGNLSRILLNTVLVGYDDIVMNSLKQLAEAHFQQNRPYQNMGYVRNVVTGEHFKFVNYSMTRISYLAAFFIMIIFTFSISMLLRYSHYQIFTFIVDLLQMLEMNSPLSFPVAPLLTVIVALVGMEAIMSEFFNDTGTAFYIILMVWVADNFDAICCHTAISRRYWLKFFYLYNFLFYAYHYRFNGQHSGLALLTSWLLIQHSMLYFFHHYELPAIVQQQRIQTLVNQFHEQQGQQQPQENQGNSGNSQNSGSSQNSGNPQNSARIQASERIATEIAAEAVRNAVGNSGSSTADYAGASTAIGNSGASTENGNQS